MQPEERGKTRAGQPCVRCGSRATTAACSACQGAQGTASRRVFTTLLPTHVVLPGSGEPKQIPRLLPLAVAEAPPA